jgi:tetratricopeptide (TPR) repeat protein
MLLLLTVMYAAGQDNDPFATRNRRISHREAFNTLNGSVRTLDGKAIRNARVEVRTLGTGETIASGYTLPNGSFEFTNLPEGIYEVVAIVGVQDARERVDFHQAESSVQLRIAGDTADTSGNGSSTVSVSQLKVPDKAHRLFAKAEELLQKQKLPQAREAVEKALQVFPNYAQALTLRGLLNLQDNQVEQARADLEQAVKDDYSYAMGFIVLGTTYNLMHRFDDAARALEHGIVLQPASWQAYYELSKALLGKEQYEPALRQINKAAEMAPSTYAAIHLVRAHALLGVKDYNQAITELEQFVSSNPNSADSARARQTMNQVRAFMASTGK